MKNNTKTKTPVEQLTRENEILGKVVLEIIYRDEVKTKGLNMTNDQIDELFKREDWREITEFYLKEHEDGWWMGYKGVHNWLIRPRKPLAITKRLTEEREKALIEKEAAETVGAKWLRELVDKEIENKALLNFKKIVSEVIKEYYIPEEETPDWYEKLVQELEEGEKSNTIIDIIRYWKSKAEKWEEEAMIHLDAIGISEIWNKRKEKGLREEIDNGLESIEEAEEIIKTQQKQIVKLNEFYLANKPLPKTPSKFRILKERINSKFQQLIKREKHQKPELIARIEVKTN